MNDSRRRLARNLALMFEAQGGLCFYCEKPMYLAGTIKIHAFQRQHGIASIAVARSRLATREHLIRRADGGGNAPANLRAACAGCNSHRGAVPWQDWKKLMAPQVQA